MSNSWIPPDLLVLKMSTDVAAVHGLLFMTTPSTCNWQQKPPTESMICVMIPRLTRIAGPSALVCTKTEVPQYNSKEDI